MLSVHLQAEGDVDVGWGDVELVHLPLGGRGWRVHVPGEQHAGLQQVEHDLDEEEIADQHVEDHRRPVVVP